MKPENRFISLNGDMSAHSYAVPNSAEHLVNPLSDSGLVEVVRIRFFFRVGVAQCAFSWIHPPGRPQLEMEHNLPYDASMVWSEKVSTLERSGQG